MRSDDSYDALGEETVKRISTERSLPHDNVIVGGRFAYMGRRYKEHAD